MNLLQNETYINDIRTLLQIALQWDILQNKTILITGSTGLICSAVTDILMMLNREKKYNIKIILAGRSAERIEKRFREEDYQFIYYDAVSGEAPDIGDIHIDYVIHGAGNAHPTAFSQQPVETMLSNIAGLNVLLKMASERKIGRLLYISSSEVYGIKEDNKPYSETSYGYVDILNPRACYPSSKRAAETLCMAYAAEYGTNIVIVRPGHIYGPTMTDSDSRAAAQFARNALRNENIVMKSDGRQLRSYCYVLDCASAIFTVLLKGKNGEAYNISNPKAICTINELAHEFSRWGGGEVIYAQPTDSEKSSYNLMSNSSLDSRKLEAMGWSPCFDVEKGVKSMIQTMKISCD